MSFQFVFVYILVTSFQVLFFFGGFTLGWQWRHLALKTCATYPYRFSSETTRGIKPTGLVSPCNLVKNLLKLWCFLLCYVIVLLWWHGMLSTVYCSVSFWGTWCMLVVVDVLLCFTLLVCLLSAITELSICSIDAAVTSFVHDSFLVFH